MKYSEMNLEEPLLKALHEIGFEEPTLIQEKAIPLIREGKDIIGQSETGSGKTAAFGIPLLEKIQSGAGLQALILAPTRELVDQIAHNLLQFSKYKRCTILTIYGGVSMNPQIQGIRHADIIVATPGRILDHLRRGTLKLSTIKYCVLDEADKMFEMGFIDDVNSILLQTPKIKQTVLFSATISKEIYSIISRTMHQPITIKTGTHVSEINLKQIYYDVERNKKFSLLTHLVETEKPELAIIFCGTRHETHLVAKNLNHQGFNAMELHGGLSQHTRTRVMNDFKNGRINILVASDVAARGIDVKNITHIFNYSIPKTSKEYVHRIGRTARIGNEGIAINLLDERDHENFGRVLSDRSLKIENVPAPEFKYVQFTRPQFSREPPRRQGFGNRSGYGGGHSGGYSSRRSQEHGGRYGTQNAGGRSGGRPNWNSGRRRQ